MTRARTLLITLSVALAVSGVALARASGSKAPSNSTADLSPVVVVPYVVDPNPKGPLAHMKLEDGVETAATKRIEDDDVTTRDLFILQITQSLEGGYDSVNMYDRGVLSWGIMQWAARYGSLTETLKYIKRSLMTSGQIRLWNKYFVANGIDVDDHYLIAYGKELATPMDVRIAFRGTGKVGKYDPNLVNHWATVFARAGRQPQIAALQVAYASKIVDDVLDQRLPGIDFTPPSRDGLTCEDLAANDPYSEALIFALWTNNPAHARDYVAQAANMARAESTSDDPALFTPDAFRDALFQICGTSEFSNWQQRAGLVEARETAAHTETPGQLTPFEQDYQLTLTFRKSVRVAELASRHLNQQRTLIVRQMGLSGPVGAAIEGAPGIKTRTPLPMKETASKLLAQGDSFLPGESLKASWPNMRALVPGPQVAER